MEAHGVWVEEVLTGLARGMVFLWVLFVDIFFLRFV